MRRLLVEAPRDKRHLYIYIYIFARHFLCDLENLMGKKYIFIQILYRPFNLDIK